MQAISFLFVIVFLAAAIGIVKPYIGNAKRCHFSVLCVLAFVMVGLTAPRDDASPPSAVADREPSPDSSSTSEGSIKLTATPTGPFTVDFEIETNIPTPIMVVVEVSLSGQDGDDIYIGHSERVRLDNPTTKVTLDASNARTPLPAGEYDAEVSFYSRWGAKDGNPAASVFEDTVAIETIQLTGTGEDRASVAEKEELRKWVMLNVFSGSPWRPEYYAHKLGEASVRPVDGYHMHDAYYYPRVDMTLIVDQMEKEITVWRDGRAAK